MIKTLVLIFSLFSITTTVNAQRYREVLKWKVKTASGGMVFGISNDKTEANTILDDFQERNLDTKYDISKGHRIFTYATLPVESKHENPIDRFNNITKRGYKVLSAEDLKALSIIETKNFNAGVKYYVNARNADIKYATARFNDLQTNYKKYIN
ncbi:hypothetical protein [Aquimarina agarilytica]|uniref:hypothetical protein n=1 Tax=Aquimarina agarilytica TaxID=1087449 RepID=UPI000287DCDE|nr:hypothetical protein [Aquimarina agarilytica]